MQPRPGGPRPLEPRRPSARRDPKWWISMRWLVPISLAMSRSDRLPSPRSAHVSITAASNSSRRRRSRGRDTSLGKLLEPRCLHRQVAARERRVSRPITAPRMPVCSICCSTRVVSPSIALSSCDAAVVAPGEWVTQVQHAPGSMAVTVHESPGRRGCLMCARVPTARPAAPSSSRTSVTDAVQEGHSSTLV